MVHGLSHFRDFFKGYEDQYILIGGSACSIIVEDQGGDFRATKDLDIVIIAEALTEEFVSLFWKYVEKAEYNYIRKHDGKRTFYRFEKPVDLLCPEMLEILCTNAILLKDPEGSNIGRLTVDEEIVSLSAILLDEDYYRFIHDCKTDIFGIPTVGINCLIPLKMRAWIDLKERKKNDPSIRGSEVNKHKNDILRLESNLQDIIYDNTPECVKKDVISFIHDIKEMPINLKNLGIVGRSLDEITDHFLKYYGISQ